VGGTLDGWVVWDGWDGWDGATSPIPISVNSYKGMNN